MVFYQHKRGTVTCCHCWYYRTVNKSLKYCMYVFEINSWLHIIAGCEFLKVQYLGVIFMNWATFLSVYWTASWKAIVKGLQLTPRCTVGWADRCESPVPPDAAWCCARLLCPGGQAACVFSPSSPRDSDSFRRLRVFLLRIVLGNSSSYTWTGLLFKKCIL